MEEFATIARFPNHRFGRDGTVWSHHNNRWGVREHWRLLQGSINRHGYRVYNIPDACGNASPRYGHRLILEAFVGPAEPGTLCCHGDGDPSNNRLENLRWDTPASNTSDALAHGRVMCGERSPNHKLTADDVRNIRTARAQRVPLKVLAKQYGVNASCISKVANGVHWKETCNAT